MFSNKYILSLFLIFILSGNGAAQKNDTLILSIGDQITGEIKRLHFGVLIYNTDDMGTLNIDWRKVKSLRSTKTFEIIMSNGMIYFAGFDTTSQAGKMRLVMQMIPNTIFNDVNRIDIVEIARIKGLFWTRFDGKINFGFGIQKANSLLRFNFSGDVTYRDRKYISIFSIRSDRSNTEGGALSLNQNSIFSFYKIFSGKWFFGATASAEQNTELGLDLRILMGVDVANQLLHTNRNSFLILGGVQATREWSASNLTVNNIEGKMQLQHKLFSYQDPKTNITTEVSIYPGLTDWGRIRTDINFNASIEVFKDFFISAGFYHKFDNRPATTGASKSDWGLDTSIGYTF